MSQRAPRNHATGSRDATETIDSIGSEAANQLLVPSESVIRDCLVRVEPGVLDEGLNAWNQAWGAQDKALAIEGKTMKNALDEEGHQTPILSAVGHESKRSYAQKQ